MNFATLVSDLVSSGSLKVGQFVSYRKRRLGVVCESGVSLLPKFTETGTWKGERENRVLDKMTRNFANWKN